MDANEPGRGAATAARRANVLTLFFLLFFVLTVWCLHSLRDTPASAPPPAPPVAEYALRS
jgi:predicted secreted protein